ncbi:MAG: DUF1579 domain-containing protein [Phycisphaerales bacterium]|nr:DUF1579 domain-containing protein [Phycisphaerales bacterium]
MKRTITIAAAASLALLAGGWVSSESAQPENAGMPDMSVMMEMMKKAAEPAEQHEMLARMAGEWKITAKFWMEPGGEPDVSKGVSVSKMVLGGRQLTSKVELAMEFMGQKMDFAGMGMMGYDKITEEFQSVWTDTMGTGHMVQRGTLEDGKIVVSGTTKTIMGETTVKNIYTFVDGGFNLDFWESGEMTGGELMHTGVIEYRK